LFGDVHVGFLILETRGGIEPLDFLPAL
jgi:hypothetical protein